MDKVVVNHNQTLLDIAMQECGSATALVDLALLNGISITEDILPGNSLLLPGVLNAALVNYLKANGYVFATKPGQASPLVIGEMIIGDTFVVG
jgi:hypothetical protein